MNKIPSFTIDHERLLRGIYVSRKDEVGGETVTTFDIRMKAKWESRKFLTEVLDNITDANLVYPEVGRQVNK